jgi:predicted TIM-barrel fold metal-dependent hydrolase
MQIVDIHPHIISRDTERYPIDPLGGRRSVWSSERPVTCEELLEAMDVAGVANAVVVQSSTTYGHDNRYLADSIEQHPDRLAGTGSVDFLADDAVDRLRYWLDERGLVGVRVFTSGSTMSQSTWLDDPATDPAWSYVESHTVPVCVSVSIAGLTMVERVLKRHPHLKVIVDHAANPSLEDGPPFSELKDVLQLSDHPGAYIKVSTHSLEQASVGKATPASFLRALIDAFGADRIAWGSNYPATPGTLSSHVALAKNAVAELSDADAAAILGGTAQALYPRALALTGEERS